MRTPETGTTPASAELESLRHQLRELQEALAESVWSSGNTLITTLQEQLQERTSRLQHSFEALELNIQSRQRMESAFQESEQRYQWLYDNNLSMYFTLSPEGTVLSVNQFGAAQLGYTPDDLVGQSVLGVFDPVDHRTVLEQLEICANNPRKTFEWELQKVRKDRTRLWVRERARAVTDAAGTLTILVVCEDVTEHRKTTQLLSTLVRESPLPIVSLDPDARVTSWNQAATRLFGWPEEDVLGRELPYVPSGEERTADALWMQGTRGEVTGPIELRRRRKDGAMLDLLLWPVFVHDEAGHLSTAVGLYVDQSDLKRAEAALKESESRLRLIINSEPECVKIVSPDGLLQSMNPAGLGLIEATSEEDVRGRPVLSLVHPDDRPAYERVHRAVCSGQTSTLCFRIIGLQGKERHVETHSVPLRDDQGAVTGVLSVTRDITARRQASEERERISRDLHDNILQSLYAVGMQLEAGKLSFYKAPRKSKSYTTQAIDQLNRLVDDVRQYIALLKRQNAPAMDFGQALRHLVASFSATGLTTPKLDIKDPVIAMITAEQGEQLLNIAREALSNSVRHAEATHRWVRLSHTGSAVRMEICDDGIGFEPKQKRKRGHGLSNMAARAKRIRARFSLDSRPRKGTCITIDLPTEGQA